MSLYIFYLMSFYMIETFYHVHKLCLLYILVCNFLKQKDQSTFKNKSKGKIKGRCAVNVKHFNTQGPHRDGHQEGIQDISFKDL